jgi:hypothetical protein
MREQMQEAYTLIREFKEGIITPGTPITVAHEQMLRLLAQDLEVSSDGSLEDLVPAVARTDSVWNKRAQAVLIQIYDLQRSGRLAEAESTRQAFVRACPSAWYCGIVTAA